MAAKTAAKKRTAAKKGSSRKAAAPKPEAAIRRFDVFAEYNRQEAMQKKDMKAAEAKGYGLWLAKLVAARRGGRKATEGDGRGQGERRERQPGEWRTLDDKPQTDKL